jgi:hypothetical protein
MLVVLTWQLNGYVPWTQQCDVSDGQVVDHVLLPFTWINIKDRWLCLYSTVSFPAPPSQGLSSR